MGYVMKPDGGMDVLSDIEWELHECGEDGDPPKDFKITFTAGKLYHTLPAITKNNRPVSPVCLIYPHKTHTSAFNILPPDQSNSDPRY